MDDVKKMGDKSLDCRVSADIDASIRWATIRDDRSRSNLSSLFVRLYRLPRLRRRVIRWISQAEGGEYFSTTLREIYRKYYGVEVGSYSYGGCFVVGVLPPGTVVGRYTSVASAVRVFRRNHPVDRLSTHPFFYNSAMGLLGRDTISLTEDNPLTVGNDVWIGQNSIILPRCQRIGDGAVVGAGAVVTRDVPDFAIVGGNPAKILRMRFEPEICCRISASRWWDRPIAEIVRSMPAMLDSVDKIPTDDRLFQKQVDAGVLNSSFGGKKVDNAGVES